MSSIGTEAEFVCVAKGGAILNLHNHGVLIDTDEIGVDGHTDTAEFRIPPSHDMVTQFDNIRTVVTKYTYVLEQWNKRSASGYKMVSNPMRGGAYYGTPLGLHVHFGDFPMKALPWAVKTLELVAYRGLLLPCISADELRARAGGGNYGQGGHQSIRIKGAGWWEWRQPYSCMHPNFIAALLAIAEIVSKCADQKPNILRAIFRLEEKGAINPAEFIESMGAVLHLSPKIRRAADLAYKLTEVGHYDWSANLLKEWTEYE